MEVAFLAAPVKAGATSPLANIIPVCKREFLVSDLGARVNPALPFVSDPRACRGFLYAKSSVS